MPSYTFHTVMRGVFFALVLTVLSPVLSVLPSLFRQAYAQDFTVKTQEIHDLKAVYATVESSDVIPARARISGTLAGLSIDEGDTVKAGDIIAVVGDEKLALQLTALDARIRSLGAQMEQAQTELNRVQKLFSSGTVPKARLDDAQTRVDVISGQLRGLQADRSVIKKQMEEGNIIAPASGRVLKVLLKDGSVIMAGEPIAMIADENYVLRLRLPQRHARFLRKGDTVLVSQRGDDEANGHIASSGQNIPINGINGKVILVYPEIENGHLVADIRAPGLDDYFVGERIRVWVTTDIRHGFLVPQDYIFTKTGLSLVRLKNDHGPMDIPVQTATSPGHATGQMIEILSGLSDGDILVRP